MDNECKIQNRIFTGEICSGKTTAIVKSARELCARCPGIKIAIVENDYHEIQSQIPLSNVVGIDDSYDLLIIGDIEGVDLHFTSTPLRFMSRKPVWIELTTVFDTEIDPCCLGTFPFEKGARMNEHHSFVIKKRGKEK